MSDIPRKQPSHITARCPYCMELCQDFKCNCEASKRIAELEQQLAEARDWIAEKVEIWEDQRRPGMWSWDWHGIRYDSRDKAIDAATQAADKESE